MNDSDNELLRILKISLEAYLGGDYMSALHVLQEDFEPFYVENANLIEDNGLKDISNKFKDGLDTGDYQLLISVAEEAHQYFLKSGFVNE